jgi:Holliday junction resolvase RusA-like endonuclease
MTGINGLRVVGVPITQGSKRAVLRGRGLGARAGLIDNNDAKLRPWREAVRSTVVDVLGPDWQPFPGPVRVVLLFALPKPASAPKRRRTWPMGARSGDIDKLARAVLDACTDAAVWRDDAQVVELRVIKDYPGPDVEQMTPGVILSVAAVVDSSETKAGAA